MARLSAAQRKKLPKKSFAGPGRSFPMNDKAHARAAVREEKFASPATKKKINARAKSMGVKRKGKQMPISGDQNMDKNDPDYSLPLDSCVGCAGPEPTEVTNISGAAKIPYQGAGSAPVGYDGPQERRMASQKPNNFGWGPLIRALKGLVGKK